MKLFRYARMPVDLEQQEAEVTNLCHSVLYQTESKGGCCRLMLLLERRILGKGSQSTHTGPSLRFRIEARASIPIQVLFRLTLKGSPRFSPWVALYGAAAHFSCFILFVHRRACLQIPR